MRAQTRPAKGRRAIAEVIAEILLIALVVSLTAILFAFFAPLIPGSLPRQLSGTVGLGPTSNLSGVYVVPVIYTSGAPAVDQLQPVVLAPSGSILPDGSWHVALAHFDRGPIGNYSTPTGWSDDTPLHYTLTAGDRFLIYSPNGQGFAAGSVFELIGTAGFSGRISIPLS